jgi:hypothetical protein
VKKAMKEEDSQVESTPDDYLLPSRSIIHPSTKGKLTRLFYTTIVTLFILLILSLIGLFLYSNKQ